MGDVVPIRVDCGCGAPPGGEVSYCPGVGAPRARAYPNGELHIKRCNCDAHCSAAAQVRNARQREGRIARSVGGVRSPGSRGPSDILGAVVDIEETTETDIVAPFVKWWLSARVQQKVAALMRRNVKPRMLWMNTDQDPRRGFVVMRGDDAMALVQMAASAERVGG